MGKSTNLSKVCFWLIQNGFKVLIAACDTFRFVEIDLREIVFSDLFDVGVVLLNNYEYMFETLVC